MKICPRCKRSIEDDSAYCGYCAAKQTCVPEEEGAQEAAGAPEASTPAPAVWLCAGCGERLEENFDTCWKCGTVREMDALPPSGGAEGPDEPLMTVWGLGRRVEVYQDKVMIAPSAPPVTRGEAAYVSPCEILIRDIVSIEFTNAKDTVMGSMKVNYSAAPADDPSSLQSLEETVLFGAEAGPEMAKALELIKKCRADLESAEGEAGR